MTQKKLFIYRELERYTKINGKSFWLTISLIVKVNDYTFL
jgi:hypothetical protein